MFAIRKWGASAALAVMIVLGAGTARAQAPSIDCALVPTYWGCKPENGAPARTNTVPVATPFGEATISLAAIIGLMNAADVANAVGGTVATQAWTNSLLSGGVGALSLGGTDGNTASDTGVATGYHGNVAPTVDCPTSTQRSTSMLCVRGSTGSTAREPYLANITLDSNPNPSGDPVALFAAVREHAGSSQSWAFNTLTHIEPGASGGIGYELDVNNWACEWGAPGCSLTNQIVGLYITGSAPYHADYAILISGVSSTEAQWREGLAIVGTAGVGAIKDFSIYTNDKATTDYLLAGTHAVGIDMSQASLSTAAIAMATGHVLLWGGGPSAQYITTASDAMEFVNATNIPLVLRASGVTVGVTLNVVGTQSYGIDLSAGTFSTAALNLATGQRVVWGGGSAAQYITSTSGALQFANLTNVPLTLGAGGSTFGSPLTLAATADCVGGEAPGLICRDPSTHYLKFN